MLGAIEAGGTKFVCVVSKNTFEIIDRINIPATTPDKTLNEVFNFFDNYELEAIGVGSFGPIDVNEHSDTYGYITTTPKIEWRYTNFVGRLKERYEIPIGWTTDVNASALGEFEKGAALGSKSVVYITVGTGIGGGAVINGEPLKGYGHPEMGHLLVRLHPDDDFKGVCPYHKNCLEGLASGPAIEERRGKKPQNIEKKDRIWEIEAFYLAQAIMNFTLTLSPEHIVLGGGVMQQTQLFPLIREKFKKLMNAYVITPRLENYIIKAGLDGKQGIIGGLLLAQKQLL